MSFYSYMQKVSPCILEKMKIYPCAVDLFLSAHTLNKYPNDYWKGIEEEQEEWEMVDEDMGEKQQRITKSIYKKLLPDIPQIIQEGLESFCVGNRDCFDWIRSHEQLNLTEIGNFGYNGKLEYLTSDQTKILANKLQELGKSGYVNAYQEFYSHPLPLPTESHAKEYFNEVLFFCQEAAAKDYALLLYIY